MRTYLRVLAITGLLAAVTLAATAAPWRHRVVEPVTLHNLDFADDLRGWRRNGGEVRRIDGRATLALVARDGNVIHVGRSFAPPTGPFGALRVQVALRTEDMLAHGGTGAGVMLLGLDRQGRQMWWWPKVVARINDDVGWHRRTLVVPLSDEIRNFWLIVYTGAERGTLWLRDVRIDGVVQRVEFDLLLALLVAGWAVLGLGVTLGVLRGGWRAPLRVMSLAIALSIVGFGLAPQPHARNLLVSGFFGAQDLMRELARPPRPQDTAPAATQGRDVPRPPPPGRVAGRDPPSGVRDVPAAGSAKGAFVPGAAAEPTAPHIEAPALARPTPEYWRPAFLRTDKDLHVIGFAVFAFVTVLAWRQYRTWTSAGAVATVSVALQAVQSLTVTREADLVDLAHDLAGAGVGVLLAAASLAAARWYARQRA